MMELLVKIQSFVDEVKSTNSSNEKIEILKKHKHLLEFFKIAYDPNLKYHVTPLSLRKRQEEFNKKKLHYTGPKYSKLLDLLKYLIQTTGSNESRDAVLYYISKYPDHDKLIWLILNKKKKLEINLGSKTMSKVFPDIFQEFEVSLGSQFKGSGKKYFDKSIKAGEKWYISRKYDGVRCIIICSRSFDNPKIETFSRYGKSLTTLNIVIDYIKDYVLRAYRLIEHKDNTIDIVFDGEIVVEDEKGNEDFTIAVGDIRKKNITMTNPRYKVFDLLNYNDFYRRTSISIFSERVHRLKLLLDKVDQLNPQVEVISIVEQYEYTENKFDEMCKNYINNQWEGLILRKDIMYKGKRSQDILKIKKENSKELRVNRITTGKKKILINGSMVEKDILAAVVVVNNVTRKSRGKIYDDYVDVYVGSGFTDNERLNFYNKPELIIGKIIRVDYMDETEAGSLRHPVFKGILSKTDRDRDV